MPLPSFETLINIVFPRSCLACRRRLSHGVICKPCFEAIPVNRYLLCGKCLMRAPPRILPVICHPRFPYALAAAGNYEHETTKNLIHSLKFRSITDAAASLAELLVRHVRRSRIDTRGFIVMPIPLSRKRLRRRGFNQSELIAASFAQKMDLPLVRDALIRTRHSKPQSESSSAAEREENVRGSFAVRNPAVIRGKNILLVDDVATSGATLASAARALKAAGAEIVIALVAAKAH